MKKTMAKTTTIHANVRIAPKINDRFYSFEYGEERTVDENDNLEQERLDLFDTCYNEVANQINETIKNS